MLFDDIDEIRLKDWHENMQRDWHQGEHIAVIGSTGTGKTTVAHTLLECRSFVCVLAVKRYDETIDRFQKGTKYGLSQYRVIDKWPPEYSYRRVVFWPRPKDIGARDGQAEQFYHAINHMYISGGWCISFDDAGYITGTLGLGRALGILLSQGRSSNISVVVTMTRPTSMVAQVPKEALNQCRHVLIFKYTDEREMKVCSEIAGISFNEMKNLQKLLRFDSRKGFSDFLYVGKDKKQIVRSTTA